MTDSGLRLIGSKGSQLRRPECVLIRSDATILVSDGCGGVTSIDTEGTCLHHPGPGGATNGIAQDRDGDLVLAGIDTGTVHRLHPDGSSTLIIDKLDGIPLGAVNFPHFDPRGGLWITVSTRTVPRSRAIDVPIPDGFLLKLTPSGPRVMAEGLCFANEVRFDGKREFLYLAESARGRVLRFPVKEDSALGEPETYGPAPLFEGAIVDGLAFDVEGGLWVTEVTRNAIFRIDTDGTARCLFEDRAGTVIDFPASIAFGGPDNRTISIGSIRMDHIVQLHSPVPGVKLWHQG